MGSIILKNIFFYKRNWKELLVNTLRIYLSVIPFYYFALSQSQGEESIRFTLLTLIIAGIISNTVIATNYELYQEIISGKMINLSLANIKITEYIFAQTIFYFFIYLSQYIMVLVVMNIYGIIHVKVSLNSIISTMLFTGIIVVISAVISGMLAVLTLKTKRFAYSSIMMSSILILSACYMPYGLLNWEFKGIALLSPFTYIINIFKSAFGAESLILPLEIMYLILVVQILVLGLILAKILCKYFNELINKTI
ncbi:MAG: ABC transporter permease [Clostridium sp.]|uniref:ABC transporter permease n=1 Tax=Clostridium sp. TaxID=1506 RepID=UPI0032176A58